MKAQVTDFPDISIAHSLNNACTISSVAELAIGAFRDFGAENIVGGLSPRFADPTFQPRKHILLAHSSAEWGERYFNGRYFNNDPIIRSIRDGRSGLDWRDIETRHLDQEGCRIMAEAHAHGIRCGYTVSFPMMGDWIMGLSISGTHLDLPYEQRSRFSLLSSWILYKSLIFCNEDIKNAHLSPRERQAFQLAKSGLTKKQIAVSMGITIHGADKHLRSIRKKFGVSRMAQAISQSV